MFRRTIRTGPLVLGAMLFASGCASSDQRAAAAASAAEAALNQGQLIVAQQYARRALAQRDDVSDYWLLLAHIDLGLGDTRGAFDAYQNVLTLDRSNLEALSTLCQIAVGQGVAVRAEHYADQLALLQPASLLPATVKAGMAFERNDRAAAGAALDEILKKQPTYVPALLLKSKLFLAQDRPADAAAVLEGSLQAAGNPQSFLVELLSLYTKTGNRDAYRRTVVRLAEARPQDATQQLVFADLLYEEGQAPAAYAITRKAATLGGGEIGAATAVLNLWLKNTNAMPVDAIVRDASGAAIEIKAAYAQYANETGHPDLAIAILKPPATPDAVLAANANARAAYAYALGLSGQRETALAKLDDVLRDDPAQPRALLARARLSSNLESALGDARKVSADDRANMTARLVLVDLLLRRNDPALAEATLREGLRTQDDDPRAVVRLARMLSAQGRRESAEAAINDFVRAHSVSLRAARLRRS